MQPVFKPPLYKRLLSYLLPVVIKKDIGEDGSSLQLILYNNQWQLAAETALYSDGIRYRPFRLAFKQLDPKFLRGIRSCAVLGTGLGSIVQILHRKYKSDAAYYLIEKEERILRWALALLRQQGVKNIYSFCTDAGTYLEQQKKRYDLICVDVFKDRVVPEQFTSTGFLADCSAALQPGGVWIMNYIINNNDDWYAFTDRAKAVFKSVLILENDQNRILIGNNVSIL